MVLKIRGKNVLMAEIGPDTMKISSTERKVVGEVKSGFKIDIELFNRVLFGISWDGPFLLPNFTYLFYNDLQDKSRKAFLVFTVYRFHWMRKHKYVYEILRPMGKEGKFEISNTLKIPTSKRCLAFEAARQAHIDEVLA